jgi:broad specificity phosphatase PhoE
VVVVWCLRHGESANVVDGVSGAVPSAPLTALGQEQARRAAPALAGLRTVYASTALRARQTAELLGGAVVPRPELVEFGIGAREGEVDAGLRRETADVLRAWVRTGELDRRVADGETGHDVLARMTAVLAEVAVAGEDAALVGHVGSLTLAVGALCGLGDGLWGRPLPHAVPFAVRWDRKRWRCPRWPG